MPQTSDAYKLIISDLSKLKEKISTLESENYNLMEENLDLKKQLKICKQNNPSLFTFEENREAEISEKKENKVNKEEIDLRIRQLQDCIDWLDKFR